MPNPGAPETCILDTARFFDSAPDEIQWGYAVICEPRAHRARAVPRRARDLPLSSSRGRQG